MDHLNDLPESHSATWDENYGAEKSALVGRDVRSLPDHLFLDGKIYDLPGIRPGFRNAFFAKSRASIPPSTLSPIPPSRCDCTHTLRFQPRENLSYDFGCPFHNFRSHRIVLYAGSRCC